MDEHLLRFRKDKKLVFIDCETYNLCLNFCHNVAWQISMISTDGTYKKDERDFYIKWDTPFKISDDAKRITRYNESFVNKNGKEPKDVFPIIKKWLDGADYIVGHNIIGFDIYLIKEMYKMFGEDYKHLVPKLIDTNCIARGVKMEIPYKPEEDFTEYQYRIVNTRRKGVRSSLTALGKEFNIDHDYDKLHNAIVDLELNLKVWNKLKYALEL
jgi:DNA polymerase III epsilon subunit-like protein